MQPAIAPEGYLAVADPTNRPDMMRRLKEALGMPEAADIPVENTPSEGLGDP
jgi:hypothetical protein